MITCKLCGIDLLENDANLCPECQREFGKKSIKQYWIPNNFKTKLTAFGIVLLVFALCLGYFQVSLALEAQNLLENSERIANNSELPSTITPLKAEVVYDITQETNILPITSKNEYLAWMTKNTQEEIGFLEKRWELAQTYIKSKELVGDDVIRAFLRTPREHFVRQANLKRAYDDTWLPIGYGATITDPDVVCMMTTSLELKPGHRVLEIGTGSGYQSAILSHLSNYVFTIEIIKPLALETDRLYKSLEDRYPMYKNIRRKLDDGFYGWEQYAPFDRIIITCAIDHVPPPLIKQLAVDGIIVAPLGPPGRQQIMQIRKVRSEDNKITITRRDVYNGVGVKFIPFTDKSGQSYYNKENKE